MFNLAIATSIAILSSCVVQLYSRDIGCSGLLTNKPINKSSDESSYCSNFSLYLIQNATICWPVQNSGNVDVDAYVKWYSHVKSRIEDFSSVSSTYSLFYGTWSLQGWKHNEDLTYESMTVKYFSLDSAIVMANAMLEFLQQVQWTRVAIISNVARGLYLHSVEHFYKNFKSNFDIHFVQVLDSKMDIGKNLKNIKLLNFRIIIVSLPMNSLKEVMCKRQDLGMTWPDYVWLVLNFDDKTFMKTSCKDQIIVFWYYMKLSLSNTKVQIDYNKLIDISAPDYKNSKKNCFQFNMKSHDISIYMWQNGPMFVTNYSITKGLGAITLNPIPSDLPLESFLSWYITFSIINILVFIFLTVMLVLYLYFRNEPAIKATGVSLNILMFLGCYLLLAFLTVNVLPKYYMKSMVFRNFMCKLSLWFHGFSIPTILISSILLVKLVRVYRLFYYFRAVKKWECHDATLALYVLLLTFPVILSNTIQSAIHNYESSITTRTYKGYFIAVYDCKNDREYFWIFGQQTYLYLICSLLIVMAFKTRKIKHKNFKDTKKVIALIVTAMVTSFLSIVYIIIFEALEVHPLFIDTLLELSHSSFILECQFFLFMPKNFPLLKIKLFKGN